MTVRPAAGLIALSLGSAILLDLIWAMPARREQPAPQLALAPAELPADGYAIATLTIETAPTEAPRISFPENRHGASVLRVSRLGAGWEAKLRAGVLPARTTIQVDVPGARTATAMLTTTLVTADTSGDGTPDVLRLDDPRDRAAFRRWFTFLAEAQYFQEPAARPAEIVDCAALIRYAYREALRSHGGQWAADARLPLVPAFDSVARYGYPYTPLGDALFRVREGSFQPSDLGDGTFAQFADAQTLQHFNTHFVSRDLERALPGDLLFYHQESDHMPFHSMIYLGESHITRGGGRYVVYHTGPDGAGLGIIRRLSLSELEQFPEPQWRPLRDNRNFLGVYRWNILRDTE